MAGLALRAPAVPNVDDEDPQCLRGLGGHLHQIASALLVKETSRSSHLVEVVEVLPDAPRRHRPILSGLGVSRIQPVVGVQGLKHHRRRVHFFSTVELINQIEQEKVCNKTGQKAHRLAHMDMVVLDELNHLPFSSSGGALPFNLLRKLYTFTTLFVENNRLSRLQRRRDAPQVGHSTVTDLARFLGLWSPLTRGKRA